MWSRHRRYFYEISMRLFFNDLQYYDLCLNNIFVGTDRVVVTSRNHFTPSIQKALDALASKSLVTKIERAGGAGFKVLRCLEGAAAYVYPSKGSKKWDTAATDAILSAAGMGNFVVRYEREYSETFNRWKTD